MCGEEGVSKWSREGMVSARGLARRTPLQQVSGQQLREKPAFGYLRGFTGSADLHAASSLLSVPYSAPDENAPFRLSLEVS